jgi:uncharacterized protein (TIGR00661 family)
LKTVKNILLCPLDWGLGHATRCVPIIKELLKREQNVIIGADKGPLAFLKNEFPSLKFIEFPGYNIQYPKNSNMARKMIMMTPSILRKIRWENKFCAKLVKEHKIDGIISDNRFGLYHPEIPCVFISHQVFIKAGNAFQEAVLYKINRRFLAKFSECWIPDFAGSPNLSGDLSHKMPLPKNMHFVGHLSRFADLELNKNETKKYELLVLISGPEPQRSLFEEEMIGQLASINKNTLILSGRPELDSLSEIGPKLSIASHMDTNSLFGALTNADFVICRSGYSTIMDLACVGKKAIFVPTPGQTEQEYLAQFHADRNHALQTKQDDLQLENLISKLDQVKPMQLTGDPTLLSERVGKFLS